MNVMLNLLMAVQMITAVVMVGLILLQHGKGADMGAAFGSGSAGSLFGASGSANFLSRTTAVLALVFFVATLALAYFGNRQPTSAGSVLERTMTAPEIPTPASQIPADGASVPAPAPAVPASGVGQIPTK